VADLTLGAFRAARVSASGAAARMVDSLEVGGLAERHAGNAKAVPVRLTRDGARTVRELLAARGAPLAEAIAELDAAEQQVSAELLGKVLTRLYQDVGSQDLICRRCDRASRSADLPSDETRPRSEA
jgi:DNA-binding MarR family transcriptional regulator